MSDVGCRMPLRMRMRMRMPLPLPLPNLRRAFAAAHTDLNIFEVIVMRRRRGPAAVARGHPPTALERVTKGRVLLEAFASDRLVHVAGHVLDPERALAFGARVGRLAQVAQHLH